MPRPLARPSFVLGLLPFALAALAGCASSGPEAHFSRDVPFPSYASAEPLRGMERSTICHQGRSITLVNIAVEAHLRHGDFFGSCSESNRTRHVRHYEGGGESAPEAPVTTAANER